MELTVISGKGGTGKTTVARGLAALSHAPVLADCDVDAPNLSLFFGGEDIEREPFFGADKATVDVSRCTKCGSCTKVCRFQAIVDGCVDRLRCEGCGACTLICDYGAISMEQQKTADNIVTRHQSGRLLRAEMEIGSEGTGKLVTALRKKASDQKSGLVIIDGSPGVGCPVIASITATDIVLIVTEPTQSGRDDLLRVAQLCAHFGVTTLVCINKYDINESMTQAIKQHCHDNGISVVGIIPYDESVVKAVNELRPITEDVNSAAGKAISSLWTNIQPYLAADKTERR